jgi:hypothetical protein
MIEDVDESNAFLRNAGKYLPFDTSNETGYLNLHCLIIFRKIGGILSATESTRTVREICAKFFNLESGKMYDCQFSFGKWLNKAE